MNNKKRVAVLKGGWSAEREVSLVSGSAMTEALRQRGYEVVEIDVQRDLRALLGELETSKAEVVINGLHGQGGEDGVIQGVLEMLQLPYTHSGLVASALSMNKVVSRLLFTNAGIPVPPHRLIHRDELVKSHPMKTPYVLKPIQEGSSRGVRVVLSDNERPGLSDDWQEDFGAQVLVEEYVKGREIHVAVLAGKAWGTIEILSDPGSSFFDYRNKYTPGVATHVTPALLSEEETALVCEMGEKAYAALQCRGAVRLDFMYGQVPSKVNEPPQFYLLEANTQPGMTPISLVPEIVANKGMSFTDLVEWMVTEARCGF